VYIKELNIKNFGKFNNKRIDFETGINLVYGENESGKTTIFHFIKSMLFGIEKQRGRAAKNDTYRLYEPWNMSVFYEGELIFCAGGKSFRIERGFHKAQNMERLINEDDAEELSIAQGDLLQILDGLNESVFRNTMAISQLKSETDEGLANELKNYTSGFSLSGDGGINVGNALSNLSKRKKDFESRLREVLGKKQTKVAAIEKEREYIQTEYSKKQAQLREYSGLHNSRKEVLEQEQQASDQAKKRKVLMTGMFLLSAILIGAILIKPSVLKKIEIIVGIVLILGYFITAKKKLANGTEKQYQNDGELNRLIGAMEELKEDIQDKEIMLSNINERLMEIQEDDKKEAEIRTEIEALSLAYDKIHESSLQLQQDISDDLNKRASMILSYLTDEKYEDIRIDSNIDVRLNTKDKIIYPEQVSKGTVDEINFAVRMAFLELFFPDEKMPLFLDDAFAMYDEIRLARALKYLAESKRQVILFTCHKREKQLLEQLQIPFQVVQLI